MGYKHYKYGELITSTPESATAINYDNAETSLEAVTVQEAVDELAAKADDNADSIDSLTTDKADKTELPTALSQLTDDATHRLVSDTEKAAWNAKYDKPSTGIAKTDLASDVQTSLGKADTALQSFTETDPTVPSHVKSITSENIASWNAKAETSDIPNVPDWALASTKPSYTASEVGALADTTTHLSGDIATTEKGSANGVATLGNDGKVPASQLPSYVDDVLEFDKKADFPAEGESGKIYIDKSTNITYRWSGTTYVAIGSDLALGETSSTAYPGDKGKAVTDAFNTHKDDTDIHITATERTSWNAKYDKPSTGIAKTDLASDVQTSLGKADTALQEHQDISGKADKTELPTTLAELTDDATHRLVTDTEKTAWNAKYDKPSTGIAKTDLASDVQTSLGKADTALQSQDISGKADKSEIPTALSQLSEDSTHRLVTDDYIAGWEEKYDKPEAGIPKSDLASDVQTSLGKADTALQEHQDISGKADKSELPTALSQLTDDATHRVVTDTEKAAWNAKYDKPSTGIAKTDLAEAVQTSLGKADTALQEHQDISGKADKSEIPTALSALTDDATHRLVTDVEKEAWNNKAETSDIPNVPDWALAESKPSYTASEVGALADTTTHLSGDIATTEKGSANGVATLGDDGKVPAAQLPSYVDDVLEYAKKADFPAEGESGKIYIDTSTNITYRWSGTVYVAIGSDLALGETSSTAYPGDKGKAVTDAFNTHKDDTDIHITATERTAWNAKAEVSDIPTALSGLTDDATHRLVTDTEKSTWNANYTKPEAGIPKSDLAEAVQTSLGKADTALQEHQDISGKADKSEIPTALSQLTDDATHRLVSDTEKAAWNAKYDKPSTGIAKTDLASDVQTSLGKADTALQEHQDISGKADKSEIPTALSQLSDDETHRVVTDTEKTTWNKNQAIKLTQAQYDALTEEEKNNGMSYFVEAEEDLFNGYNIEYKSTRSGLKAKSVSGAIDELSIKADCGYMRLTQEEYDALPEEEKVNGTTYYVETDNDQFTAKNINYTGSTSVKDALDEVTSITKSLTDINMNNGTSLREMENFTCPSDGIIIINGPADAGTTSLHFRSSATSNPIRIKTVCTRATNEYGTDMIRVKSGEIYYFTASSEGGKGWGATFYQ